MHTQLSTGYTRKPSVKHVALDTHILTGSVVVRMMMVVRMMIEL